jgi:hypothetical protein
MGHFGPGMSGDSPGSMEKIPPLALGNRESAVIRQAGDWTPNLLLASAAKRSVSFIAPIPWYDVDDAILAGLLATKAAPVPGHFEA